MNIELLLSLIRNIGYTDTTFVCIENNILLLDFFPNKNEKVLWKIFPEKKGGARIIVDDGRFVYFDLDLIEDAETAWDLLIDMVLDESNWI